MVYNYTCVLRQVIFYIQTQDILKSVVQLSADCVAGNQFATCVNPYQCVRALQCMPGATGHPYCKLN